MTTDTIWKQALTATGSGTDAPNWTLGLEGSAHVEIGACSITAFWWSPPAGATGTVGWRIYSGHIGESNSLLASGNLSGYIAGGGWQRFAITPQDVTGINFMACLYTSSHGDYAYKSSPGFPVDDGVLVSVQSGFREAADAAPNLSSALSYMLDFELTYGGGSTVDVDATDSATLTDAPTTAVAATASDSATSTETAAAAVASSVADAATAGDAPTVAVAFGWADSISLAELQDLTVAASLADLAVATCTVAVAAAGTVADVLALSETIRVDIPGQARPATIQHYAGAQRATHYTGPQTAISYGG